MVQGANDEEDAAGDPAGEEAEVVVAAVDGDDRSGRQIEMMGHADVTGAGRSEQNVTRQVVVVVHEHMRFDPALGAAELGPREER